MREVALAKDSLAISQTERLMSNGIEDNLAPSKEKRSYSYFAYGLGIHSEIFIPEFCSFTSAPDVRIRVDRERTPHDYVPQEAIDKPFALKLEREEAIVYLQETGVFLIQGGNQITVIPTPEASEQLIRYALVGTVMAILLYQRDLLVLHASAVNIDGEAVAFLGQSGEGKSTIAAAFHAQGHNILTDDVAPVSITDDSVTVAPGFPQIKLSPEVAAALGYDYSSLRALHPQLEKRGFLATETFSLDPLPLKRIYVLATGDEVKVDLLSPREAVMELIRHSRPTTLYHAGDKAHFAMCASLANKYRVYRLQRPRNLALLGELVNYLDT